MIINIKKREVDEKEENEDAYEKYIHNRSKNIFLSRVISISEDKSDDIINNSVSYTNNKFTIATKLEFNIINVDVPHTRKKVELLL